MYFAKLESGKLIPLSISFTHHEVLLSLHEPIFTHKGNEPDVYFHIVTSPKEPLLYREDPHCMMQIVTSLLSNACKNIKHGFIMFVVRDTSCGMKQFGYDRVIAKFSIRRPAAIPVLEACPIDRF
jgi:hypothetical protein